MADWSSAAAGVNDALHQLVAQRLFEQAQAERRQAAEWDRGMRERDLTLREQTAKQTADDRQVLNQSLIDQRNASIAAAEAKRAADEAAAKKTADTAARRQHYMTDPSALTGLTPVQRLLALSDVGLNTVNIHGVETPEEHGAHLKTDQDAAFGDWQRKEDYRANQQRKLATIKLAARPTDDPTLPQGVKAGIVRLASQGLSYDDALKALAGELQNQMQVHPRLDPQKAVAALQAAYRQPTGTQPLGRLQSVLPPTGASVANAGRGRGPTVPAYPQTESHGAPTPAGPDPRIGKTVTVKGQRYTVKAINPDGTADLVVVR
jgi:hypothetical protein